MALAASLRTAKKQGVNHTNTGLALRPAAQPVDTKASCAGQLHVLQASQALVLAADSVWDTHLQHRRVVGGSRCTTR
mgnify:CR=1 FL=1